MRRAFGTLITKPVCKGAEISSDGLKLPNYASKCRHENISCLFSIDKCDVRETTVAACADEWRTDGESKVLVLLGMGRAASRMGAGWTNDGLDGSEDIRAISEG